MRLSVRERNMTKKQTKKKHKRHRCWNVLNSSLLLDRNPRCNHIRVTKILVGLVQQQHDLASRQYYVQVLQCAPVRSRATGAKPFRKSCGRIKKHKNNVNNQLLQSQRQQQQKRNISSVVDPVEGGAFSVGSISLPSLALLLDVRILGA